MIDYDSIDYLKKWARWTLKDAIRKGAILRGPCEVGADCEGRVHGHHSDYRKPLNVRWLCRKHHSLEHHAHRCPGICHYCERPMRDYGRYIYCSVECGLKARKRNPNSNGSVRAEIERVMAQ